MMGRNCPSESNFSSSVPNKYLNAERELKFAFAVVQMQPIFSVDLIGFVALTVSTEGIVGPPSQSQQDLKHSRHCEQEQDWLLCKSDLFQIQVSLEKFGHKSKAQMFL